MEQKSESKKLSNQKSAGTSQNSAVAAVPDVNLSFGRHIRNFG